MRHLRTALFMIWLVLVTLGLGVVFLPFLILPNSFVWIPYGWWVWLVLWGFETIIGVRVEVRGRENIPDQPVLVASKHQAMWDTVMVFKLLHRPAVILKRELFYIPFYGWGAARLKMIPIDRAGHAAALKAMVAAAKDRIAKGRSIIIYPEGTRVKPGENAGYKPGVAALYRQLDVPCLPIALNSGYTWPNRGFGFRPGTITVDILPPIPPGLQRKAFMETLEDRIETASNALLTDSKS